VLGVAILLMGHCNYNEEVSSFGGGVYNSFISDGKETKKLDLLHRLVQKSPTRNHSLQELRMLLPKEDQNPSLP